MCPGSVPARGGALRAESPLPRLGPWPLAASWICPPGHEAQGDGIDAVAQAGGPRPVLEDVAEVGVAPRAEHLRAHQAQAAILAQDDAVRRDGPEVARPAGAGFELGVRRKQRQAAADARVGARRVVVEKRARTGAFGALAARDPILLGREQRAPFGVGLDDFSMDGSSERAGPAAAARPAASAAAMASARFMSSILPHVGLWRLREAGARGKLSPWMARG